MIRGKSVYLRPIEREDLSFLLDLANHAYVSGMVVGWDFPVSLHGQQRWFENSEANAKTRRLMVVDAESNETIGLTGLWDIDWHNSSALTATKLHPDKIKKGMGSDAIMVTMAWAFYVVGIRRLYGSILDFNGPSLGAYVRRCGWRIEGLERESIFRKGRWCDLYRVAILRSDFERLPSAVEYTNFVCPVNINDIAKVDCEDWDERLRKVLSVALDGGIFK